MTTCPCCGQPLPAGLKPEFLPDIPGLQPLDRRIVAALAEIYPRAMNRDALANAVYAHDIDGGPDNPWAVVATRLVHVRREIANYGWQIPSQVNGRGSQGRYCLRRIQRDGA